MPLRELEKQIEFLKQLINDSYIYGFHIGETESLRAIIKSLEYYLHQSSAQRAMP